MSAVGQGHGRDRMFEVDIEPFESSRQEKIHLELARAMSHDPTVSQVFLAICTTPWMSDGSVITVHDCFCHVKLAPLRLAQPMPPGSSLGVIGFKPPRHSLLYAVVTSHPPFLPLSLSYTLPLPLSCSLSVWPLPLSPVSPACLLLGVFLSFSFCFLCGNIAVPKRLRQFFVVRYSACSSGNGGPSGGGAGGRNGNAGDESCAAARYLHVDCL